MKYPKIDYLSPLWNQAGHPKDYGVPRKKDIGETGKREEVKKQI